MMMIKKILVGIALVTLFNACKSKQEVDTFSLTADIKNLPAEQAYLEEVYFGDKEPEVLDTAEVKNGKFVLSAAASQEGLYRVRFEKSSAVFLVINDKKDLSITADLNNLSPNSVNINSPANASLKNFINETNKRSEELNSLQQQLKADDKKVDTALGVNDVARQYEEKEKNLTNYVFAYADTCSSPTLALFALGYVADTPGDKVSAALAAISKRFPGNSAVASVMTLLAQRKEKEKSPAAAAVHIPQPGDIAPDITMPDTEGKMFSLSSLRGKYVLVDFWASWCGPCRGENPNVVKAYNKYSSKNFTVLGVSLDKKKEPWLEAIQKDGLVWKHISDLKQWDSEAQKLYQFEGIPYNVLLDPQGKILATSLRGEDLEAKLAEVLK